VEKTFETPEPIRVDLRVPFGDIEIEAAPTATTEVWVEGSDELLERTTVELHGNDLRVHVRERRALFLSFGRDELAVRVRCPEGSTLRVQSASADVVARGRLSGDASFEDVSRELSVQTASGDLDARRIGSLTAQVVSGDIRVRDADGPVSATSVSGDVRLDAVAAGRVRVEAVSGDVTVGIRRGSAVHVDASTLSGDTRSELDLDEAPSAGPEATPEVDLRIRTVSGDISVVRAPAPMPQEV
jgi:DUF4097 and DUF4098 domain-containing protein YvlB